MTRHALCLMYFKDSYEEWHKPIPEGESYLGRGAECEFVIDNEKISREHIKFVKEGDSIYLENVSSFGIIEVNGETREHVELNLHDRITFEGMEFILKDIPIDDEIEPKPVSSDPEAHNENPADDSSPESSDGLMDVLNKMEPEAGGAAVALQENEEAPWDVSQDDSLAREFNDSESQQFQDLVEQEDDGDGRTQVLASVSLGKLVVLAGPGTGREFPIAQDEIIIGRSPVCDIVIEDDSLSRKHSKIVRSSGAYRIVDLESSNGTRVNGIRVIEQALKSFDTIQIGDTEFRFVLVHRDWEEGVAEGQFDVAEEQNVLALSGNLEPVNIDHLEESGLVEEQYLDPSKGSDLPPVPPGFKGRLELASRKWKSFHKTKKILYVALVIFFFFAIQSILNEQKPEKKEVVTIQTAPLNKDIPPEFFELTEDVRLEIERAYNNAVSAYQQKNWIGVIKQANIIKSRVPYYKEIDKILPIAKQALNEIDEANFRKIPEEEASEKSGDLYYYLAEGDAALIKKDWQNSRDNYEKALEIDPTNYEARRGRDAARNRQIDKDWKDKLKAKQSKADEVIIDRITQARLVIDAGQYDQSISMLEELIRSAKPNDPNILENAKEWLEHARKERVAQWEPELAEGEELIRQGRYEEAFKVCKRVSDKLPEQKRPKNCMNISVLKLEHRARKIYRNALIEEYLGNQRVARNLYKRIVQSFPEQLDYYRRAATKLRRYDPEN